MPDNTLPTARNLGNLTSTLSIADVVNSNDTVDFYRFSLAGSSDVNIALTGLSANANIRLIRDANGNGVVDANEVIASSSLAGTTPDSINVNNLGAGTYFVAVDRVGNNNTNYTLRLSPFQPSNLIAQEANLGNLAVTPVTRTGFIGNADTSDIYRFRLASVGDINIALTGLGLNTVAGFRLIRDANNNGIIEVNDDGGGGPIELIADEVIVDSFSGFNFEDPINVNNQAAGSYFVQVYQFDSNETNYSLRLSNTGISNLLATRDNFGTLSNTPITRIFTVDDLDTSDIYRFNLAGTSDINIALTDLTADADVRLIRDANGNGIVDAGETIAFSTNFGATNESINLNNQAAGDYFVQVYQFSPGPIGYHLGVSNSDPSNLLTEEENLGVLPATAVTRFGFVGNSDTSDIYRFSIFNGSDINISLTGLTADADLRLYRDNNFNDVVDAGEEIASSLRGGTFDDLINLNQQLGAGNYFAQVHQFNGETNYTLRLSTDQPSNLLGVQEDFGLLNGVNRTRFDTVGNNDTSDIYRFSLDSSRIFGVSIDGLTADADLRVIRDFNSNGVFDSGEELARSARGGTSSDFLNLFIGAGDYFVQVYQFSGEANYTLTVA